MVFEIVFVSWKCLIWNLGNSLQQNEIIRLYYINLFFVDPDLGNSTTDEANNKSLNRIFFFLQCLLTLFLSIVQHKINSQSLSKTSQTFIPTHHHMSKSIKQVICLNELPNFLPFLKKEFSASNRLVRKFETLPLFAKNSTAFLNSLPRYEMFTDSTDSSGHVTM